MTNFFFFFLFLASFIIFLLLLDDCVKLILTHTLSYISQQSNKVPVVQHAHHVHPLTPLITYSNEHFSPGTPPSHLSPEILDPKTGKTYFIEPLFSVSCMTDTQACLGSTCRYSPYASPIGALSLLPPVSWSCGFHCSPTGLVHATVSFIFIMHSKLVSVANMTILVNRDYFS